MTNLQDRPGLSYGRSVLTYIPLYWTLWMLFRYLGHNGFWIDELYTLHSIRLGWREMVMERLSRGHFPGYFALVRMWYSFWPDHMFEVALRSMSILFYVLALVSFAPLAWRVVPGRPALVALILFACNEIALRQAVEARMYTVVLFIAVWMVRAWYELQQPDARRVWSIALPLLTAAGFAVSATVGVLIGSMLIISVWKRHDRRTLWVLIVSLLLGLAIFIPGALLHVKTSVRIGISASKPLVFLTHPVALMPGVQIYDDYFKSDWRSMVLLVLGIPVTLYAIWALWKARRQLSPEMRRMALIVALPFAIIIALYPAIEIFELDLMGPPRYFITLLPMASILGAWAICRLPRPVLTHIALSAFLMFGAWTILTVRVERFREQMVDYLKPRYAAGDGLVVTANEIEDGVELYVPGSKVDKAISRWEMDKTKLRAELSSLSDRKAVWIVWYRGNASPLVDVAEEMWGPFESNKPDKERGSLRVFKFQPGAKPSG